jgi:hypothetical protein
MSCRFPHLNPNHQPLFLRHGLIWGDVLPVLEEMDSINELRAAVQEPLVFLERLAEGSHRIAKKLAIMHLKPPLEPHLAKHGLEWADVVPVLEEVDSIDELKAAMDFPVVFLQRIVEAGDETLGITVSSELHILGVAPGSQGMQKGICVGDIMSRVGSHELVYDGSTPMDVKVSSLLSKARARGEAFVRIEFNEGAKGEDFKIKSRLTAALASEKSQLMLQVQLATKAVELAKTSREALVRSTPNLEVEAPPAPSPASTTAVREIGFGRCPSPSKHTKVQIQDGLTVKEQQQRERHQAQQEGRQALTCPAVRAVFSEAAETAIKMADMHFAPGGPVEMGQSATDPTKAAQLKPLSRDFIQSALEKMDTPSAAAAAAAQRACPLSAAVKPGPHPERTPWLYREQLSMD